MLCFEARLVDGFLGGADLLDQLLLLLPARAQLGAALLQVGQLLVDLGELGLVLVALDGLALDLELAYLPFEVVELLRHRVDLDAEPGGRLVDEVDGLVREEPVRDVPVAQLRRRHDGAVGDAHAVVHLVFLLDAAQDRDGVLYARLFDEHHLEAAFERLVLLEVLAILVEGGRADGAELAASEGRLEDVGCIHRALGRARADERVDLVDEQDDLAIGFGDLFHDGLEAVLELTPVLGAGDERAHVERVDALVLEALGHVALHDADGDALGDGGLTDAGLTDEHRVVLRPAREDLKHPPNLFVAPDDRVDLALFGEFVQVARIAFERLIPVLGMRIGHPLGAAHVFEDAEDGLLSHVLIPQRLADGVLRLGQRDEQMLAGDVLVLEQLRLGQRPVKDLLQVFPDILPRDARAGDDGQLREGLVGLGLDVFQVGIELLEHRANDAAGFLQKRLHQMGRLDALVIMGGGDLHRLLNGLLCFHCKLLKIHSSHLRYA